MIGLLGSAMALGAAVGVADRTPVSWVTVAVLAAAIAIGEARSIDLPFHRAGRARFALGDVSLAAGLMVASPAEVVIAAAAASIVGHLVERQFSRHLFFNVGQYMTGAGLAASVVVVSGATPGVIGLRLFLAAALGIALFTLVNALAVSGIIALTSDTPWKESLRKLARTGALVAVGNIALGFVAVLLLGTYPWALPALVIPLALLFMASRQDVRAQLERERSSAYASVERELGELSSPEEVAETLARGTMRILGCRAALWTDDGWVGEVPDGSGPCPVDPKLATPLITKGPSLGPAVDSSCAAIGVGGGVLVVWRGEMALPHDTEEWLERLAGSGRAHFERAAAAAALEKEQATLRGVVDGTRDGICVLDADGVVRLWNPAMARLAGVPATTAVGASAWQVLGEGPWTTDGVHDVERTDGERVWRLSVSTVRDDHHGSLRVAVVHDVTAERRVARMKDDMLAVVSHELRTPLTPIKASAQLLRRRWERMQSEDREKLLERIEERSDHLARLVADILLVGQLSAADGPRIEVSPVETDLAALLHELVTAQRQVHPSYELSLAAPDVLPAVTDPMRVRQVIENLVDNACKYSPQGSPVTVTLVAVDHRAVIEVADQGRGIAPDDLERVFERFERVDDPLLMTTSGVGLGLYIVRELVTALGGEIEIDSTPGVGTTVQVRLPLRPPEPTSEAPGAAQAS